MRIQRLSRLVCIVALLGLFVAVLPATTVHAASTVTVCTNGAATSFDTLVNTSGIGDTITFSVDCPDPGTPIAPAATLTITHDLTIDGSGHTVAISGSNAHGVLVVSSGTLRINALTIEKGKATGGNGGGINSISSGPLVVTNSAFIGNVASNAGGAIVSAGIGGGFTIVNSTFFNNSALFGGAVVAAGGTTVIINSTITGNTATSSTSGGGGLWTQAPALTVKNTIVAGNTAPTSANCATFNTGTIVEGGVGHNLEYGVGAPASTCAFAIAAQTGDPKLDVAPALNSGHTPSFKLLLNSAALDNADPVTCQNALPAGAGGLDQRGLIRFPTLCSIGAFEPQVSGRVTTFLNHSTVGTPFSLPFTETVADNVGNKLGGVLITFSVPTSGPSGTFPGALTTVVLTSAKGSGIATTPTFTANGVAGSYFVTVTIPGFGPSSFGLTNLAGPLAVIASVASTTPQITPVGASFSVPLAVTVTDQFGNPLSGQVVTFIAPTSGASGTFAGGIITATTNASGIATAPTFFANNTQGSYQVTATVPGLTTTFALTNTGVPLPPSKPGAPPSGSVPSEGSRAGGAPSGGVVPPPSGR